MGKIAAGRNKPRGFTVIDAEEAAPLLAPESVRLLPGVGPALAKRMETLGITRLGHLQGLSDKDALRKLGEDGPSLVHRSRGEDSRPVDPGRAAKSVSAETTFEHDLTDPRDLERHLFRLCEKLAKRLKAQGLAAGGVVLKLKTAGFATRTRAARLSGATALPDRLFEEARGMLAKEATGTAFRLIGIGAAPLAPGDTADLGDLADQDTPRRAAAQAAIDALRGRFGDAVIQRGRLLG